MFTEKTFDTGQLRIAYVEGPRNGPPIVFLHGVTRRWNDFVAILPAFAPGHHIFALDARGHGGSGRLAPHYEVMDYVREVVSFLTIQMSEPAILFGHSLGAMVAMSAAVDVPQRVKAIILEDPPLQTMGNRIAQTQYYALFLAVQRLARGGGSAASVAAGMADIQLPAIGGRSAGRLGDVRDAAALRFAARCVSMMDPEVLTPIIAGRWLEGFDHRRIMASIRCPTLLVQADEKNGGALTNDDVEMARQLIEDCVIVKLGGVGHQIHWNAAERLVAPALAFVESLK